MRPFWKPGIQRKTVKPKKIRGYYAQHKVDIGQQNSSGKDVFFNQKRETKVLKEYLNYKDRALHRA